MHRFFFSKTFVPDTGIDDELVKSLSKLLHENKNLKNLNLESTDISGMWV
jgi:hypothetical protein